MKNREKLTDTEQAIQDYILKQKYLKVKLEERKNQKE